MQYLPEGTIFSGGLDPYTNTYIDQDGQHWALTGPGNWEAVDADYINSYVPSAAAAKKASDESGMNISQMATQALTALQTYQLNQINVQRAKQGLPPINTAAYGTGINIGLSQQTQQLVMWGGIALLAVLLVGQLRK